MGTDLAVRYVEIALNLPIDKTFSYSVPDDLLTHLETLTGCRVEVNFRNRKTVGYIINTAVERPEGDYEIKKILRVLDEKPLFGNPETDLAEWIARRYFCSIGEVLGTMLPGGKKESTPPALFSDEDEYSADIQLSDEQEFALEAVLDESRSAVYLYGITGSGKTEVYLRAAASVLEKGEGVIYLVPEISLTHQIVKEARRRFGKTVSVWHSKITPSQRLAEWRRIRTGEARMVIGARSAVFAPLSKTGLIIIDEEHEGSYKSGSSPRYHARQVAFYRSARDKGRLIMGSATPSVEAVQLMQEGKLRELRLTRRLAGGSPPEIQIINMAGQKGTISRELTAELKSTLGMKRQAILFLNRRGYSYFFHCKSCGYEMKCRNCSVSLTFHKNRNRMLCHYCGYQSDPVQVCPECGSLDVGYSGYGTEGIEDEIKTLFPESSVERIDTDTVSRKGSMEQILNRFHKGETDILLGTQMVAKGLNFPGVRLVGIVMADTTLLLPDFRSAERTFSLLTQVAGRAGRFHPDGRVLIQTFHPQASAVYLAAQNDPEEFYRRELETRRMLKFPPASRLIRILFRGKDRHKVTRAAEDFSTAILRDLPNGLELLGPGEAPLSVISGNFRMHMILRGSDVKAMHSILLFYSRKLDPPGGTYREIDADPVSLL